MTSPDANLREDTTGDALIVAIEKIKAERDRYRTALEQIAERTSQVAIGFPCYPLAGAVTVIAREVLDA